MISIHNASIHQGERLILNNCDIFFEMKKRIFIHGTSGSGKSSLLKVLIGQKKISSGKLIVLGNDMQIIKPKSLLKLRRQLGVILREPLTFNDLTIYENLQISLKAIGWNSKEGIDKRIDILLDKVKLKHLKNERVEKLSFSEKRRLDIARSIMNNPKIVIAEDPTSNLDDSNAQLIMDLLIEICDFHESLLIVLSSTSPRVKLEGFDYYSFQNNNIVKDNIND